MSKNKLAKTDPVKDVKKPKKIVGLPLSEDYIDGGIKYDPSQKAPK